MENAFVSNKISLKCSKNIIGNLEHTELFVNNTAGII